MDKKLIIAAIVGGAIVIGGVAYGVMHAGPQQAVESKDSIPAQQLTNEPKPQESGPGSGTSNEGPR